MFGLYPGPIIYSQMDHSKNIYPFYNSSAFHDACGTGFIVTLSGKPEKTEYLWRTLDSSRNRPVFYYR
jgi:hypothetical protein